MEENNKQSQIATPSRELKFMTIFPDDRYFTWQCHMWLESLRDIKESQNAIVLIFTPQGREQNKKDYQPIIDLYPEVEFNWYKDEHNISSKLGIYIPILRPYTAWRYWTDHPEMKENAILYCDSDILFTDKFDLAPFLDDDIIYASDTNSYINASYFDSKIKDVLPERLEEYKTIDVLDEAAKIVGINRQICEANNMHSGGTQYLFKNIDVDFWKRVMDKCIPLKQYLMDINRKFFESENKGLQSWTCDMWLVLWELWRRGQDVKVVPELDFAWSPDNIEKLDRCTIFHNAGITGETMNVNIPCFYKAKYHQGNNPMIDPYLDVILSNEESKKYCTWYYTKKLDELRNKYPMIYDYRP